MLVDEMDTHLRGNEKHDTKVKETVNHRNGKQEQENYWE